MFDFVRQTAPITQEKLLAAGTRLIRRQGYAAASVDAICAEAGVTKGAFFHHFASKEALAAACTGYFAARADAFFAAASYQQVADPRERVLAYVAFRASLMRGELEDFTCLLGMLAQETFATAPAVCAAAGDKIKAHARDLARDVQAAKERYAPGAPWQAEELACYIQATIQGAFVLAKATHDPAAATMCLQHLSN
jgi:TetR/AcrR family transcriptional repressor of nem operon